MLTILVILTNGADCGVTGTSVQIGIGGETYRIGRPRVYTEKNFVHFSECNKISFLWQKNQEIMEMECRCCNMYLYNVKSNKAKIKTII